MKAHVLMPWSTRTHKADSYALRRVESALTRYAPENIEFVPADKADLTVINVIGRRNKVNSIARSVANAGRKYAIIQYCLKSTQRPNAQSWLSLWRDAVVVWSYLDLTAMSDSSFNFYHAPLGADAEIFKPEQRKRHYVICTSGLFKAESVREAVIAAKQVGREILHLGAELDGVQCHSGLTDKQVADVYNQCEFVSGLRRIEGFELPAAEGLLCGARPIVFDRPHYRNWYEPWAEFIQEGPPKAVIDCLQELFSRGARAITKKERASAAQLFDWRTNIVGFWQRCLNT